MRIGALLTAYRERNELTFRQLADEIGISHTTLMRIEDGGMVDGETIIKLFIWAFC